VMARFTGSFIHRASSCELPAIRTRVVGHGDARDGVGVRTNGRRLTSEIARVVGTPDVGCAFDELEVERTTMRSLRVATMALILFSAMTSLALMSAGVRGVHVQQFRSTSEGQMLDAWVSLRLSFALLRGGGGSKDAARRVDEYGFPKFSAMCVDASVGEEFPLQNSSGYDSLASLCASMESLPRRLCVKPFARPKRTRVRNALIRRVAGSWNRNYDVEDFLNRNFQNGPFSSRACASTGDDVIDAYFLPLNPYFDRVMDKFRQFSGKGRGAMARGVTRAIEYASATDSEAWVKSGESCGRFSVITQDASTGSVLRHKDVLLSTTFVVSASETIVPTRPHTLQAPFHPDKDVSAVGSLSFVIPMHAARRNAFASSARETFLMFRGAINSLPRRRATVEFLLENTRGNKYDVGPSCSTAKQFNEKMKNSRFCLYMRGTRVHSPRLIESMLFGCVPVILADDYELPLSWLVDWSAFSVRIPESDFQTIPDALERANSDWDAMHRRLRMVLPLFVYHRRPLFGDAFWATALGVERQLRRRRAECTTNVFANVSSIPWNTVGSDTK